MSDKLERKDIDHSKIDWNEHAEYWNEFDDAKLYTKNIYQLLSDRIDLKNLTILDFGCGTGLLTDYMTKKAKQIVAVDYAEKMIQVLNNKNYTNVETIAAELSQNTIDRNPALQTKFDLIVAASVCAFLPNYEEVLTIIKSLLKPDGIFVQWDWLKNETDSDFGFTEDMIGDFYSSVGLQVESVGVPFHFVENEDKMEVLMAIGKI